MSNTIHENQCIVIHFNPQFHQPQQIDSMHYVIQKTLTQILKLFLLQNMISTFLVYLQYHEVKSNYGYN